MNLNIFELITNIIETLDKDGNYKLIKFKDRSNTNENYEESILTFMTKIGGEPIIFKYFDVYYDDNGQTYRLEDEYGHVESIGTFNSDYEDYARSVLSREVYESILNNFRKLYNVDLNIERGKFYINGKDSNIDLIEYAYCSSDEYYDKLLEFERTLKERIEEIINEEFKK